ncbi:hypothetical protein AGMMS49975_13920 [Clostridia bacterium]|nr:hypothetical protein AGMMS49975_13920 [Clostridia bacterium]
MTKTFKKLKRFIALILTLIIVIQTLPAVNVFAAETHDYSYNGYTVAYDITSSYGNTQNIQVTLKNTGAKPIENWALLYLPHGNIINIWNAVAIEGENGTKLVTNTYWNSNIAPNSSVSFGYTLENADGRPDEFNLQGVRVPKTAGAEVKYTVLSDWGSGFSGTIEVKNNSTAPIMSWNLSFDADVSKLTYNEQKLSKNADGQFVLLRTDDVNIQANATVNLSITGAGNANSLTNFVLSEVVNTQPVSMPTEPETPAPEDSPRLRY